MCNIYKQVEYEISYLSLFYFLHRILHSKNNNNKNKNSRYDRAN